MLSSPFLLFFLLIFISAFIFSPLNIDATAKKNIYGLGVYTKQFKEKASV